MADKKVNMETVEIKAIALKQKQSVLDLETGNDVDIEVVYNRYVVPDYDEKYGTPEEFTKKLLSEASKMVTPAEAKITALVNYASSQSYQEGKKAALNGGKYLTQDLRSKIVQIMRANSAFADLSAKDCFDRWKSGYLAKKAGAVRILAMATESEDFSDL